MKFHNDIVFADKVSGLVKVFVVAEDLILCNLLFPAFFCNVSFAHSLLQTRILLTILLFCCSAHGGVVLHIRHVRSYQIVAKVLKNVVIFSLIATPILVWCDFDMPSWPNYLLFLGALFACSTGLRIANYKLIRKYRCLPGNLIKVVFVGDTENSVALYHEIADDQSYGYSVCGYFSDHESSDFPAELPRLGRISEVTQWLGEHTGVHCCYCCLKSERKADIVPIIKYCENNFIRFYHVPNIRNYVHNRMYFNIIGNVPFLSLHNEPLEKAENRMIKRLFDICFSLLVLCTVFPVVLIIAWVAAKLTMPGPLFFKQKRNGLNGKEFYCLKFRSMKINAEADSRQASEDDPRITKWGHFMRKTNIDELPQFVNVLLGDMSVVGPRPHMVKQTMEYSQLIDKYMVRHYVKPGITGWSQVTGSRGETRELSQMEERIQKDIWYVEHWSMGLDLFIIYKTVVNTLIGDKNAY